MSLLDDLASPPIADKACSVAALLAKLPEQEAALVRAALEPRGRDTVAIRIILRRNGYYVTGPAIDAHKAAVARSFGETRKTLGCSCTDF